MTPRYVKLEKIERVKLNSPSSRTKPDAEINHAPNTEFTVENRAHLNPFIQGI